VRIVAPTPAAKAARTAAGSTIGARTRPGYFCRTISRRVALLSPDAPELVSVIEEQLAG